jgi:citrate synthase
MKMDRQQSQYLSSCEASDFLGVKTSTLYSYVSKGLIRSVPQAGNRANLYFREDLEKLSTRIGGRAGIPETVETAVRWGQPVLKTSITEFTAAGPLYRGRAAIELARCDRSFESVAQLLWTGMDDHSLRLWRSIEPNPDLLSRIAAAASCPDSLTGASLMSLTSIMTQQRLGAQIDYEREDPSAEAAEFIKNYACALGLMGWTRTVFYPQQPMSVAQLLANSLIGQAATPTQIDAINSALIVCADHELSPATFSARVAASTGADLHACIQAAAATHSGTKVGGGCDRSQALLQGVESNEQLDAVLQRHLRIGTTIPGFNPESYPKNDPRATFLIDLASSIAPQSKLVSLVRNRLEMPPAQTYSHLKIDLGLICLADAIGLPPTAASAIWLTGRCAGWVAHVLEQRLAGFVIRPRAKYISLF